MRINDRLNKLIEQVQPGESVADIGTDHGYVPLALLRRGISPQVIMSDVSEGSMAKAVSNFEAAGYKLVDAEELVDMISSEEDDEGVTSARDPSDISTVASRNFRVADGLDDIAEAEVDDIMIAGMGGLLMIDILGRDMDKTRSFKKLILQPRNNSGALRYWLFTHDFRITSEELAEEGKFICEIITAEPSGENIFDGEDRGAADEIMKVMPPKGDIRWQYPSSFRNCDRELLTKRLEWKFSSIQQEIDNLRRSSDDQSAKISGLKEDAEYLKGLLE